MRINNDPWASITATTPFSMASSKPEDEKPMNSFMQLFSVGSSAKVNIEKDACHTSSGWRSSE